MGWERGGTRVNFFFFLLRIQIENNKKKFGVGGGGGGGWLEREGERGWGGWGKLILFYNESKFKIFFFWRGVGGGMGGVTE